MTFDIDATAGSVYGIVGTGISLGVLSGMAGMVMRSTERMYGEPVRTRRRTKKRTYTRYGNNSNIPNIWDGTY